MSELARLRFNQGLTPEQLGEKIGISGQTIRRIEAGAHPRPRTAKKIADYFEREPSDLFFSRREAAA